MGCVGSKRSELLQEELESQKSKASISSTKRSSFASGRLKYIEVIGDGVGVKEREKIKSNGGSDLRNSWSWEERKEKHGNPNPNNAMLNPRFANPPKHLEGEYVAAGWPTWLSSVAGEAIRGWIPRRADSFEKLDKVYKF
jgi:cyclin-dependent kinase 12/13